MRNIYRTIVYVLSVTFLFIMPLFVFAGRASANFTFASWADTKSGTSYFATLSKQLKSIINPAFTLFEGDLEDSGYTQAGTDAWVKALNGDTSGATSNSLFDITFEVRGNHDDHVTGSANLWAGFYNMRAVAGRLCTAKGGTWNSSAGICTGGTIGPVNFAELNTNLTYSFDYENAHFVGLDVPGDKDVASSAIIAWLDADLAAAEARGQTMSFVFFHGPVWPISYHCCSQSNPALDLVLYKHKSVAATLHGHEHIYAYSHISNARVANKSNLPNHEFEQFHTGNAGAEGGESCPVNSYNGCFPDRWDYFMGYGNSDIPRGFVAINVSGLTFTAKFYKISATTPDETLTFTHDSTSGYTHCTGYNPYNSAVDSKLAATCGSVVATPTPAPLTPTPTKTPTPTPTPTPIRTPTPTSPVSSPTPVNTPPVSGSTLHFTANEDGAYSSSQAIGFNIHDTGMSTSQVNSLPAGSQAMVWVGVGASNCSATLSSTFTSFVLANATNPKLYGFYLTDEPLDSTCVAAVTAYTSYIHTNAPGKKSFILLTDWPGTYAAYRPAVTGVDLVALDPYPVQNGTYNTTLIPSQINAALAAGIPLATMVPVYQTFGGQGWDAPTAAQLTTIINQFAALIPSPQMDYAYSWGLQSGALTESLSTRPDWQTIMAAHNAPVVSTITPTPTPVAKPGDASGDGKVDETDYGIWLSHFGTSLTGGASVGDFTADGKVDGVDYVIWLTNYGK